MFKVRVIPCLDVKDGRVVKGVNFVDLRDAGDPVEAAIAYDAAGADELCFLDITATHENRGTMLDVVRRTAEACFMPLTVGGGVRTIDDIKTLLRYGADKVSINSAAVSNREFVKQAAEKFGEQCIVVAIDAKQVKRGGGSDRWEIFTHGGRNSHRDRRHRIRPGGRVARRRRNPADVDGPRRHRGRGSTLPLTRRPSPTASPYRSSPPAASAISTIWSTASARATPPRCWPPRYSTSANLPYATPRSIWRAPGCRCGSIPADVPPRHKSAKSLSGTAPRALAGREC